MKITFKNDNSESNIEEAGRRSLEDRSKTLRGYMKHGTDLDCVSLLPMAEQTEEGEDFFHDHGSFFDYGLSIDYVTEPAENDVESYLRYQLSCGGPSEEIRFYYSPGGSKPYRVEFVFLDWFCGIGFDVTGEDWVEWLNDFWQDCGTAKSCIEKAMEEA